MNKFCVLLLLLAVNYITAQKELNKDSLLSVLYAEGTVDTIKAKIYIEFAKTFVPNNPDSIIYYATKGASIIKSNKKWKAHLINTIGVGYYYKSENDSALKYYLIALKLREEVGNQHIIGTSLNNIAVIYQITGETEKAMEFYMKNLKIQEKVNDLNGIANVCQNIGNLYNEQRDPRLSLRYYNRVLEIREKFKDSLSIAQVNLNIANSYDGLKMQDSAYYYLTSSIPVLLRYDRFDGLGQAYNGLGTYYYNQYDQQQAIDYFIKSKENYQKIGDRASVSYELVNIGLTNIDLKDYRSALKNCMEALPIILQIHYPQKLKSCYSCLYQANKGLNKPAEALKYHEKLIAVTDSLFNQEKTKEITTIELTHKHNAETELAELKYQKDLEIKEHEKDNQRILIYFIIFGLAVSVFLIFFIINRFNLTKKQNVIIESQKKDVEDQKEIIMEKQKEILDSIHYAKRIQTTLLAHSDFVNENIPNNFILFKPKDIVSGDFYWVTKKDHLFYLAVCDSTGHGVPGAFMSLLNIGFLTEAINEKNILAPNEVFDYVRNRLVNSVSKEGQQDGFDGILICMNQKTKEITYAAAHNSPIIVSDTGITQLGSDKMPVGIGIKQTAFQLFSMQLKENETLYLYTDGYADQFGGIKGKKFMYKKLNQLLVSIAAEKLDQQKKILENNFNEWKGKIEQVDDVLIIGIKI